MIRYPFAALACLLLALPALAAPPTDPRALSDTIDKFIAQRLEQRKGDAGAPGRRCRIPAPPNARPGRTHSVGRRGPHFPGRPGAGQAGPRVERLLDSPGYVTHFTNAWEALLVPENNGQNRRLIFFMPAFEAWLRRQFADNVPYSKMVHELLTYPIAGDGQDYFQRVRSGERTDPSPLAFFMAKESKPEELAAATARLFLGVKLECAQCHDHPFAKWTREQFWETAAFFAGLQRDNNNGFVRELTDRREMAIPNTSKVVQASFLDGTEPRWKYKVGPRVTFADWVTSRENPFFARAAANRMWAHFFGIGIVDPVDDLGDPKAEPSHPELLTELAKQFADHGFDLKYLIRAIVLSKTYQLSSLQSDPSQDEVRLFGRMAVKGMTAEQLFDSVSMATGFREPHGPTRRSSAAPRPAPSSSPSSPRRTSGPRRRPRSCRPWP